MCKLINPSFNHVKFGRYLSYLLRHNPSGLNMTKDGYVLVDELINLSNDSGRFITKELLKEVVSFDDKQRFSFNEDYSMIRANQGHSICVDIGLSEVVPDVYLFHGTSPNNVESILVNGIDKMKRNHVHLSKDLSTAIDVGRRHCGENEYPSILLIDVFRMVKDGYKFYLSENNVWLTDNVPSKYLTLLDNRFVKRNKNLANINLEVKEKFLTELFNLYNKYGVSIGCEDYHSGFILNNYNESDVKSIFNIGTFDEELSDLLDYESKFRNKV